MRKRKISPSRRRYEQANPTISFRLPLDLRQRLQDLLAAQHDSAADFVEQALGVRRRELADLERAKDEGHRQGYEEAKKQYEVIYQCSSCKQQHLSITSPQAKEAAARMMYQAGWRATSCASRRIGATPDPGPYKGEARGTPRELRLWLQAPKRP